MQTAAELPAVLRHFAGRPEYAPLRETLEAAARALDEAAAPRPLTVPEAARMLGVTVHWIRERVRKKQIPFKQAVKGGHVLLDEGEVRKWWRAMGERRRG